MKIVLIFSYKTYICKFSKIQFLATANIALGRTFVSNHFCIYLISNSFRYDVSLVGNRNFYVLPTDIIVPIYLYVAFYRSFWNSYLRVNVTICAKCAVRQFLPNIPRRFESLENETSHFPVACLSLVAILAEKQRKRREKWRQTTKVDNFHSWQDVRCKSVQFAQGFPRWKTWKTAWKCGFNLETRQSLVWTVKIWQKERFASKISSCRSWENFADAFGEQSWKLWSPKMVEIFYLL